MPGRITQRIRTPSKSCPDWGYPAYKPTSKLLIKSIDPLSTTRWLLYLSTSALVAWNYYCIIMVVVTIVAIMSISIINIFVIVTFVIGIVSIIIIAMMTIIIVITVASILLFCRYYNY